MSQPHTNRIISNPILSRVSAFKHLEIRISQNITEYPRMIKSCDILGTWLRVKDLIVQSFHLDAGAFAGQFWPLITLRWPLAPAKAALPALAWATSGALWSESLCNSNRDHVY